MTAPVISAGDLVERAAEIIWNDLYGARAGAWDNPPADSVAGIQMRATAAAALSEATARIQTLEAALKPFAEAADVFAREYPAMLEKPATSCGIRFDALQAARYSLNQDGGKP
jgi:lambda repressor-like predicted transcriptional regulator